MIVTRRRWVTRVAALVFGLALVSGCSPSDESAVNADAQAPAIAEPSTTTPSSQGDETTVLDVEVDTSNMAGGTTIDGAADGNEGHGSGGSEGTGGCVVEPVPPSTGLDPFYTQGCAVNGFQVVANEVVDPEAIVRAAATVGRVLAADDRLSTTLAGTGVRLGIIGRDQRTTEMPEYRDLNEAFPETDWDTRARGLGATLERPLVSAGEENVLCLPDDRYLGEDILLHEFSHVLHEFGYAVLDPGFDADLFTAYEQAMANGTWADTYAATNHHEYWAEGVQSYFGRNLTADPPDGVHGPIDTRAELEAADPALYALIDQRLGTVELAPQCG